MSLDELKTRFREVQRMQDSFLERIREFKRSDDPSILPDIEEADRLEQELLNIAEQLSPSEKSVPAPEQKQMVSSAESLSIKALPPQAPEEVLVDQPISPVTERRRSSVKPLSAAIFVDQPSQGIQIEPEQPIIDSGSSSARESVHILEHRVSLGLDEPQPESNSISTNNLDDESVKVEITEVRAESDSLKDEKISEVGDEVRGRRRKTQAGFVIVKEASEAVAEAPTFGAVMNSLAKDMEVSTPESELDIIEKEKDSIEKNLIYVSPTPPASPPPPPPPPSHGPDGPITPPLVSAAAPFKEEPTTPRPLVRYDSSPLIKSNERRKKEASLQPTTSVKEFWRKVRDHRQKVDQIYSILQQAIDVQTAFKRDSNRIRVRHFGITGAYLFRPPKPNGASPEPIVQAAPEPYQPHSKSFKSEYLWAVVSIQRWFKRWSQRRRERLAMVASVAETEAVELRAALRKRRLDRRKQESSSTNNWINIPQQINTTTS